jgi:hypothetical protein
VTLFGVKVPKLGQWFWKRLISWAVILMAHVTVGWIVWASPGAAYLGNLGLGLVAEALVVYTFYFSGALVSDWAKLAASVSGALKVNLLGVSSPASPPPAETPPEPKVASE